MIHEDSHLELAKLMFFGTGPPAATSCKSKVSLEKIG